MAIPNFTVDEIRKMRLLALQTQVIRDFLFFPNNVDFKVTKAFSLFIIVGNSICSYFARSACSWKWGLGIPCGGEGKSIRSLKNFAVHPQFHQKKETAPNFCSWGVNIWTPFTLFTIFINVNSNFLFCLHVHLKIFYFEQIYGLYWSILLKSRYVFK